MRNIRSKLVTAAAVVAAAVSGGAIADAASSSTTSSTSTPTAPPVQANIPAHGSATHEDAEKTVTGAAASKAQAAAVKAAGGGTAGPVTTDYTQDGYEVTVTKAGGSQIEIHLDSAFNAMQGPGGQHGPPPASPGA